MNKTDQSNLDLAIFQSRPPLFSEKLYVGRPNIGSKEKLLERFSDILDKKWLSNNGPYVQELEKGIEHLLGMRHCVAMANGTVALEILIRACGLTGEVIIPSFTFIATAHALQWQEITPVFCDIDPLSYLIDPLQVEQLITPRTTGIIGVHLWGRPCNVTILTKIAHKHNLKLIFDASHAFACSTENKMIGNFGEAETFSFHATKFINTFEGGAIVTNNDELADKIRLMRNFGFTGLDKVVYIGTNGKMNEVSAAMGLTSLESMDEFIRINYKNYKQYKSELESITGISLLTYDENEKNNYQYIVIELDPAITQITRDELMQVLHAENIVARRYFYPGCHNMEPYRSYFPHAKLLLTQTESIANRILVLPTGTSISVDDITKICNIIKLTMSNADAIKTRLKGIKNAEN